MLTRWREDATAGQFGSYIFIRDLDSGKQLLAIKWLSATITFDDEHIGSHMFIGGKPLAALLALASSTNRVGCVACINNSMVTASAVWTMHISFTVYIEFSRYSGSVVRNHYIWGFDVSRSIAHWVIAGKYSLPRAVVNPVTVTASTSWEGSMFRKAVTVTVRLHLD